jgi:hypothetical protein
MATINSAQNFQQSSWRMPQWDAGTPPTPEYNTVFDPKTMSLTDYLEGKYDKGALNMYKQQAMRKGPSSWAKLALVEQGGKEASAREKAAAQSNAQTAQAQDELAAKGGLSSGARERAVTEGAKNYLAMSQDLAKQGAENALQIGMNDEQNRIQQLSALPGMEMQQAGMYEQARGKDVANTLAENDRRNQYNKDMYSQQMSAWAANRQAQATENSGKK